MVIPVFNHPPPVIVFVIFSRKCVAWFQNFETAPSVDKLWSPRHGPQQSLARLPQVSWSKVTARAPRLNKCVEHSKCVCFLHIENMPCSFAVTVNLCLSQHFELQGWPARRGTYEIRLEGDCDAVPMWLCRTPQIFQTNSSTQSVFPFCESLSVNQLITSWRVGVAPQAMSSKTSLSIPFHACWPLKSFERFPYIIVYTDPWTVSWANW